MGETKGCGMFDFMQKKEEKPQDDAVMKDLETTPASEDKEKHTLIEELNRTRSNSSSFSDEEEEGERKKNQRTKKKDNLDNEREEQKKKKKKKGLKEKIHDKISGEKEEDEVMHKDASPPLQKCNEEGNADLALPEEKKGFLEKIKDILPGHHKKIEGETPKPPSGSEADGHAPECETEGEKRNNGEDQGQDAWKS